MLHSSVIALALITAPAPAAQPNDPFDVDDTRLEFVVSGGTVRWYRVFVPSDVAPGERLPVIVCFHGGGGNATGAIQSYGIGEEARERRWIALFPEGTGPFGGPPLFRRQSWNGGDCCGYAQRNDVDDVRFFADMLAKLEVTEPADLASVFVTGMSNGAVMTYRIAVDRPDLVRAIAPVAGALETTLPAEPIPLLAIHGALDSYVPVAGGPGPNGNGYPFASQRETIRPFLAVNGAGPLELITAQGAARIYAARGTTGAATWVFTALDGGHTWPGSDGLSIDPDEPVHADVPATALMFDFFELQR